MKSYIGVNYIMAVNQLLRMSIYWDCYCFVDKVSIGNMFTRIRYQEVLQNLHFVDNTKQDKTDKGYKTKPIIDHLNDEQRIDEFMTRFKGRSLMRQYLKMKPIKWRFKWWFRCTSSTGHLNKFDLYSGWMKDIEVNFGESVVMQISGKPKGTDCTFFDPALMDKLFEDEIYVLGTVQSTQKDMPKLKDDKKIPKGEGGFHYSKRIICCKW